MRPNLRVALIQADLHWESKAGNLAMFEEKIWQIQGSVDLIVLPEMFTTGFSMRAAELAEAAGTNTFRWLQQQAQQTGATIIGSYIVKEEGKYFNRLYAVHPDGSSNFYNKKHLFGLAGEAESYSAGTERLVVDVKGWKILPLICYDLRFPVWARSRKSEKSPYEYDALVYVANWPKPRIKAWDTLLSARAIENIAYSVGVNRIGTDGVGAEYVGHSAAYDYLGEPMTYSEKEEILQTEFSQQDLITFRERFPFQKDADDFLLK